MQKIIFVMLATASLSVAISVSAWAIPMASNALKKEGTTASVFTPLLSSGAS